MPQHCDKTSSTIGCKIHSFLNHNGSMQERYSKMNIATKNYRQMKHTLKKCRAGSIQQVGMGSGSNYREYSDRRRVKQAIMQNNSTRFRLTKDTPPLQDPLLSDLGYLGIMEVSQQILAGTYVCPPGVDEFTKDFLSYLQFSHDIAHGDRICTSITKDDFQQYWHKVRECTSSLVSGLHFGHYKLVAHNDVLSEMHAIFMDIAVTTGFSPM